jgi:hypothetical protein
MSGELIAMGQNSSLAKPLGQILRLYGIVMYRDKQMGPLPIGDRGSGWEGDVIPGLIDEKRTLEPHILQKLLVEQGGDVLIEEIFRHTSGAGGAWTVYGMAYIDGNYKIPRPTITDYRGPKNHKRETRYYQVNNHLALWLLVKINI